MKLQKLCVGAAPAQAGKRRAEDEESISKRRRGDEPLGGVVDLGVRHTCTQTHAHMLIHHAHGNTCTRTRSSPRHACRSPRVLLCSAIRNKETACRYLCRWIDVPWSGWGFAERRWSRGLVFKYHAQVRAAPPRAAPRAEPRAALRAELRAKLRAEPRAEPQAEPRAAPRAW